MKLPGTVYLVQKIYILSLASTTLNFIKQYKVKKLNFFLPVAKKRSRNENALLNKLSDAIIDENIDNSLSYFDESDFNKDFPKNLFDGTNFFHMNISSLCRNFDDLHTLLSEINLKFDIIGINQKYGY